MRTSWQRTRRPNSQLVVIGSSAGGIEALSRVVGSLPPDFPAPIVIAQHLDPRRPSHLGEILARHATMPIKVVEGHGVARGRRDLRRPVEPARRDRRRRAAPSTGQAGQRRAVGRPAARDGRGGLRARPDRRDPDRQRAATGRPAPGTSSRPAAPSSSRTRRRRCSRRCRAPSRRRSSTRPPISIRSARCCAASSPPTGRHPKGREGREFAALLDRIRERSGIDFSTYKTATIVRRLRGRMGATGPASLADYAKQLEHRPGGVREAHQQPADQGHRVLPRPEGLRPPPRPTRCPMLIEEARADGRQLRVWSAGCSTGEEAYSLAITLAEALGRPRALARRAGLRDRHRRRGDRVRPARRLSAGGAQEGATGRSATATS